MELSKTTYSCISDVYFCQSAKTLKSDVATYRFAICCYAIRFHNLSGCNVSHLTYMHASTIDQQYSKFKVVRRSYKISVSAGMVASSVTVCFSWVVAVCSLHHLIIMLFYYLSAMVDWLCRINVAVGNLVNFESVIHDGSAASMYL